MGRSYEDAFGLGKRILRFRPMRGRWVKNRIYINGLSTIPWVCRSNYPRMDLMSFPMSSWAFLLLAQHEIFEAKNHSDGIPCWCVFMTHLLVRFMGIHDIIHREYYRCQIPKPFPPDGHSGSKSGIQTGCYPSRTIVRWRILYVKESVKASERVIKPSTN